MHRYVQAAEADDPGIGPLCTDEALLPPRHQLELTPLGRRLHGFEPWWKALEQESHL